MGKLLVLPWILQLLRRMDKTVTLKLSEVTESWNSSLDCFKILQFFFLFCLWITYLHLLFSFWWHTHQSIVNLHLRTALQWSWQTLQSHHRHCHTLFVYLMHHTLVLISSCNNCHTIHEYYLTEEVVQSSKEFNGLQHKALMIQDAINIVNTFNQQNLQHKVNASSTKP
jgi:hypothetical protein